jgi:FKBP-type peptidyl-prolyl cis-trans isomerase FklB
MKRLNLLATVMVAAVLASCGGAGTGKVTMNDVKDSISYAIGMGRAVRVYKEQLPYDIVDSVTIKQFVKGFMEAASNPDDNSKLAYALGLEIGFQEMNQVFPGMSQNLFGNGETFNKSNYVSGFRDGMLDNWKVMSFEDADDTANRLYELLMQQQMNKSKEENQAYLEKKAREENVVKTPSGLLYQVIKLGDGGPKPTATSDVEVRYRGEFIDGTVFDEATTPVTLNLGGVIKGWTEGIQLMSVGDKYRFFIPYDLGYGENGYGSDIKPYSTLVFEVELVSFK